MKMSDFVDEIEDFFDEDLSDMGLYDDYEHWYEKRGGEPFLIFEAPDESCHGMNVKALYTLHEEVGTTTREIYEKMMKGPLLKRITELERQAGRMEEEEIEEAIPVLEEDRELFFTDVM